MKSIKATLNGNVKYLIKHSLNNDNARLIKLSIDPIQVDSIADRLVEQFGTGEKDSREFYCKVAYYIPQTRIDYLVTQAIEKGRNPGALFNYLARKEMGVLNEDK